MDSDPSGSNPQALSHCLKESVGLGSLRFDYIFEKFLVVSSTCCKHLQVWTLITVEAKSGEAVAGVPRYADTTTAET
jgi:hypothetical protein